MSTTSLDEFPDTRAFGVARITFRRTVLAAMSLSLLLLLAWLCRAWLKLLSFDDAYMFYRYALNIAHGLGISWNPDGVHTYGMTSQLWVFFILPLTTLPLTPGHALQLASWLVGCAALATMGLTVMRRARSYWLQWAPAAFAAVALPLVANPIFAYHLTTGMDTMVALWANAAVVFGILEYTARPTTRKAFIVGTLSLVAILARPDTGLCALGSPLLAWLMLPGERRWRDLSGLAVFPAVLIGVELLLCKWYFEVPLPLGFYAKSLHSYAGFRSAENAVQYAYMAALCALPFAGALAATLTRKQLPIVVSLLLPAALTVLYLLTVRQVMGFVGRYYIPLLPFIVVQAVLSVDGALVERVRVTRRVAFGIAVAVLAYVAVRPLEFVAERKYFARVVPAAIAVPTLPVAAPDPIAPTSWFPTVPAIAQAVAGLPAGATIAASEVGYLACIAPHANIIDLVGLNDTRIGIHGFSMEELLARAPDLIWLPHTDYTGLRATMFADPRLFAHYIIITNAFNYGIAIRRDSPMRNAIEQAVRAAWSTLYPSRSITDYIVSDRYVPEMESRQRPAS